MQETGCDNGKVDVLIEQELSRLDAYWRAANYLSGHAAIGCRRRAAGSYMIRNLHLRNPLHV